MIFIGEITKVFLTSCIGEPISIFYHGFYINSFFGYISDPSKYQLQESDFEKTFSCNIAKTLQKPDRHKLFEVRDLFFKKFSLVVV